jgi:hypothetical protein
MRFIDYYTFRYFYFNSPESIITVKWVALLLRIQNVPGSNLGSKNAFAGWQFSVFSSVQPLNTATVPQVGHDRFLLCLFQLTIHIWRSQVLASSYDSNKLTRWNSLTSLLLDVCVWLNMFRASLRPLLGAYNCTRSLWFYRWSVTIGALETTTINAPTASLQR